MSKTLNPSEAIYGFCSWLTTRDEKTVMSANNDTGCIIDLIKKFCQVNDLPEISEDWPNYLIHPVEEASPSNNLHDLKLKDKSDIPIVVKTLELKACKGERSVETISFLQQVMNQSGLSPSGKDKKAVYEWFVARYNPEVNI